MRAPGMGGEIDAEAICKAVMDIDPKMRSARIINHRGHLVAGGMKGDLQSLEAKQQDEMMFMELVLRVRMRREFDAELGAVHFSLSYRDKVILMSFPLADNAVMLTSGERDLDFGAVPFKVLDAIKPLKAAGPGYF